MQQLNELLHESGFDRFVEDPVAGICASNAGPRAPGV